MSYAGNDKHVMETLDQISDKMGVKAEKICENIEENTVEGMKKIENGVVSGYKKIEDSVVGGYKKIEDGVVGGFTKMTDKFVDAFLTKEGETVEEAKVRLAKEQEKRSYGR